VARAIGPRPVTRWSHRGQESARRQPENQPDRSDVTAGGPTMTVSRRHRSSIPRIGSRARVEFGRPDRALPEPPTWQPKIAYRDQQENLGKQRIGIAEVKRVLRLAEPGAHRTIVGLAMLATAPIACGDAVGVRAFQADDEPRVLEVL
jgi:hypothetical protein